MSNINKALERIREVRAWLADQDIPSELLQKLDEADEALQPTATAENAMVNLGFKNQGGVFIRTAP